MTIHNSIPFPSDSEKVYAVVEAIGARLSRSRELTCRAEPGEAAAARRI